MGYDHLKPVELEKLSFCFVKGDSRSFQELLDFRSLIIGTSSSPSGSRRKGIPSGSSACRTATSGHPIDGSLGNFVKFGFQGAALESPS